MVGQHIVKGQGPAAEVITAVVNWQHGTETGELRVVSDGGSKEYRKAVFFGDGNCFSHRKREFFSAAAWQAAILSKKGAFFADAPECGVAHVKISRAGIQPFFMGNIE
jgi:hypothetical protein